MRSRIGQGRMAHGLSGHTAIVTGGARGLGLGIARRLAVDGCRVVIWDVAPDTFDKERAGFEPLAIAKVDVTDAAAVATAFNAVVAQSGRVEILVNNAGITGPLAPTWDYPLEDWARVLRIDLDGVFHGCRAAAPHMRANKYGRIVNVASIAGKEGVAGIAAYSAAKAGVIALSKALSKELVLDGVTVNCVAPAMAATELIKDMSPEFIATMKAKIPMGRFLEVDEVAAMVSWIASPECSFTTGFTFDLTGGRATY